jgi:F-type H+-transporting ATPase subunit epsilon
MQTRCEIISQDRIVFDGDVDIVVLPGTDGMMGILPNHSPLLTVLHYGIITVRSKQEEQFFTVAGGVAEVQPEKVTILADAAENVEEIDDQRAEAAKRRAEELLTTKTDIDTDTYLAIQASLRRSNLRLEAVRRFRRINKSPHRE